MVAPSFGNYYLFVRCSFVVRCSYTRHQQVKILVKVYKNEISIHWKVAKSVKEIYLYNYFIFISESSRFERIETWPPDVSFSFLLSDSLASQVHLLLMTVQGGSPVALNWH
jgi:hypothetical protein